MVLPINTLKSTKWYLQGNLVLSQELGIFNFCDFPFIFSGAGIIQPLFFYHYRSPALTRKIGISGSPVVPKILLVCRDLVHGMVNCSGGGQTKLLHFVSNMHVIKDNLFPVPPLFRLIQEESGTPWQEMYKVFNIGHRMEYYLPENIAGPIMDIAASFGIDARIIGHCEASAEKNLTIQSQFWEFGD